MPMKLATEQLSACPVCGASSATLAGTYPDLYIETLYLWQCDFCQLVYLNPRLGAAATIQIENKSEVYRVTPEIAESVVAMRDGLVAWFEDHTGRPGAMLDVGCNRGHLLEAARRRGWQPFGLEIAPAAIAQARQQYGLRVFPSLPQLQSEVGDDIQFDLITAWHVLEHTPDPVTFLHQFTRHLRHGGILALEVPSYAAVEEYQAREQLGSLICAAHNHYFTAETMHMVIQRAGFHVLEIHDNPEHLLITALASNTTHIRLGRMLRRLRAVLPFGLA